MAWKPAEKAAVAATIDPASLSANTYVSDWVDMADFEQVMAVILVGAISTNGTLDAKLRQATDASGTGAKDIAGHAITQLTQAGTDSNKQVILQTRQDLLDVDGGFRYVALSLTTATAASIAGAVLLGFNPTYGPAYNYDLDSVDEIVG